MIRRTDLSGFENSCWGFQSFSFTIQTSKIVQGDPQIEDRFPFHIFARLPDNRSHLTLAQVISIMMPENQPKGTTDQKRFLLIGIVAMCALLGILVMQWQDRNQRALNNIRSTPTLEINLPTVQFPTIPPSAPEFTVSIQSIDSSGITGKATFKDIAGVVAIFLYVEGLPTDEESEEEIMPAELHSGTCAEPGPLAYPMSPPDAGQSETDLTIDLKELNTQKPMAILLYRSLQDRTAVACGDIQ